MKNLLRALFVTFAACVGTMIGAELYNSAGAGMAAGGVYGLAVVLMDRLLNRQLSRNRQGSKSVANIAT